MFNSDKANEVVSNRIVQITTKTNLWNKLEITVCKEDLKILLFDFISDVTKICHIKLTRGGWFPPTRISQEDAAYTTARSAMGCFPNKQKIKFGLKADV